MSVNLKREFHLGTHVAHLEKRNVVTHHSAEDDD